jgi:hypothetical protein
VECNLNVPKAASPLHMTFLPKVGVVRVGRFRSTDHMSRIPSNCRAANVSQGLARDYHSPRDNHINSIHRSKALTRHAVNYASGSAGHLDSDDFLKLHVWNKVLFNKLPLWNLTAML